LGLGDNFERKLSDLKDISKVELTKFRICIWKREREAASITLGV
jgi:hypothetical protein